MTELNTAASSLSLTLLDGADVSPLFSPVSVGGLKLRNRLAMAPMTRQFSPDGIPGDDVAAYYGRRAASLGLLITEGTYVDESAGSSSRVPRFFGDRAAGRLAEGRGGRARRRRRDLPAALAPRRAAPPGSPPYPDAPVISPSGLDPAGNAVAEPATEPELDGVVAAFARAAAEAKAAGFDGVELHGAHGYLLDQFHWPVTNRRTDRYGGDMAGRVRLSAEIVAAVRAATGPQFPIAFRFSQWKGADYNARIAEDPAELEAFLTPLADGGRLDLPRLRPPLLAARLRRLGPYPGRLDQAPDRPAGHHGRLGRGRRRVPRRRRGGAAQPHPRPAGRPARPRRVRPGRGRPGGAGRPRVGRQGRGRPPVGHPPLRQVRRRDSVLRAWWVRRAPPPRTPHAGGRPWQQPTAP